ncbi:MetQ/NlpA family ABC transporter substrate-binding protein [Bacillus sp. FJAT-45350]|uniref:MetQ/NlpA family ABC transporter substrate-binding protein n=1 Tax=Bacillus sp. FJAT-45350 TaxID=2011014 RepID=UPI000BB990B8|nr:MetQ/NlpA family ABC transporter substrate-binding protein [Bacillus sp. FJAT-45350]
MKKFFSFLSAGVLSLALVACGGGNDAPAQEEAQDDAPQEEQATEEAVTLVIGASNVPHAEVLEFAQPILAEEGINLQIETFQDYVLPNQALDDGTLDANYFQHIPYLEAQMAEHGYEFVNAGGMHIEPFGLYTKKYASIDELPEGAEIVMSNSIPDHGRVFAILEDHGLVTLAEGVGIGATVEDVVENPRNFTFRANIDASMLPQAYEHEEGDAVFINANFALGAGLHPGSDALVVESPEDNPYVNVVAVREGDETRPEIQKLIEVLQSEEVRNFILEKWEGDVVPAF